MDPATTILDDPAEREAREGRSGGWIDVCHIGVALRVLVCVHAVVAIGAAFVSADLPQWIAELAIGSSIATPATLGWLVVACGLRRFSARWPLPAQELLVVALGAVCAFVAGWPLRSLGEQPAGFDWALPFTGAAFAVAFVVWLRLRVQAELPEQTAAQIQELQARIRPHFLFNTINTAVALVRVDPHRAEGVLEDLADLFRVALADDGAASTLGAEIDIARRYLDIEQLRFGDRLRVQWQLDPAADGARVPPLLLQPLVENAVRHGVEPAEEGGTILIRTRADGPRASVRVSNTGAGADSPPGHGIGLESVRRRLLLMHDVQARFSAGPRDGGEYRVDIAVPLEART